MATEVKIPSLGESVTEAVILRWIKNEGDAVAVDDPLCELETDKANVELPAPVAGVLKHLKKAGDTVRIGEAVAAVEAGVGRPAAAPAAKAPEAPAPKAAPAAAPAAKPAATAAPSAPAAAKPAAPAGTPEGAEAGLPESLLQRLSPSKRQDLRAGKLTKEAALALLGEGKPAPASSSSLPAPTKSFAVAPARLTGAEGGFDQFGVKRVEMTKIRKKIAERLVAAQHQAAMLTTFNEIDMTEVMALREKYKQRFSDVHGINLGFMSFFSRAAAQALQEFPSVNGAIDGNDVLYHDHVHLGVAVSTERGLVVPVLRNVQGMGFARIEIEIKRMAGAARDGKLSLNELGGGTFTITNGGVFGSMMSTPIINAPQSGILGLHAIIKRPVGLNDQIVLRPMMYVALSYDHRLVDGKDSVSFLVRVKQLIEDPSRLMLEV